jgi:hypothetical protein
MANYPSSASTDSNLYVAVNSLATTLAGALTSSGGNNGANIEVVSTANFPSVGYITIDQEAIKYTSLLSGPPRFSGITRGADGTIAASHANSSAVKHNVIADHHNVLKEEIKAIESDLLTTNPPVRKAGDTMTGNLVISKDIPRITLTNTASGDSPLIQGGTPSGAGGNGKLVLSGGTSRGVQLYAGSIGTLLVDANAAGVSVLGTNTNDNASAGFVGQYIESVVSNVNFPTSNTYGDATSISLTAGDWDVSMVSESNGNGTGWTRIEAGITTTSGNSGTGIVMGSNYTRFIVNNDTTMNHAALCVPSYRMSLSATTTVYLKFSSIYSVPTPLFSGRLSARRVR